MKYFTDEKYQDNTAWTDYAKYCQAIWKTIPKELQYIHKGMLSDESIDVAYSISLHDGRIKSFELRESTLKLEIDTDNFGALRKAYFCYENVCILQDVSENIKNNSDDNPNADIMCHEIEQISTKEFRHTLLFASTEELLIEFEGFSMRYEDIG